MTKSFKYEQIKEAVLCEAAEKGTLRVPSERELCRLYNVSRRTARRALQLLEDESVVTRSVGRGTFIDPNSRQTKVCLLAPGARKEVRAYLEGEVARYCKAHPRTSIDIVYSSGRDMIQFIKRSSGAKLILSTNFGYLAHHGIMQPLNQLDDFQHVAGSVQDRYLEWHRSPHGGIACYSLPIWLSNHVLGFNVDYADKLGLAADGPQCMDELLEWNRRAPAVAPFSTSMTLPPNLRSSAVPISLYAGLSGGRCPLETDGNGEAAFDFTYGPEWIELCRRIFQEGKINMAADEQRAPLLMGKTLYNLNAGPWLVSQSRRYGSARVRACLLPPMARGSRSYSLVHVTGLGIVSGSGAGQAELEQAWDFLRFLVAESQTQQRMVEQLSFLPANKTLFNGVKGIEEWEPYIKALDSGILRCDHAIQHGVYKVLRKYFYAAVAGEISIETAVDRINEIVEILIEVERESNPL